MKKSLLPVLALLLVFTSFSQVLDPNDPIVEYDPENPPATPAWGTLAKWVITPNVNWNTDDWKSYYYNQVPFRLRYPNNYDPNRSEPYPLIVILHGRGFSNGTIYMNDRHLNNAGAQTYENGINNGDFDGFILCPQGTSGYFGDGQYNAMEDIIEFIDQQHNLDINRVSVTGRSAGAQAVWRFIDAKPRLFSAVLPMAGAARNFISGVDAYKFSSIWLFQGELDPNPHPDEARDLIDMIVAEGGNVRYTEFKGAGHGIFNQAYAEDDFFPYFNRARKFNPVVLSGELVLSTDNNSKLEYDFFPKNEFCPGDDVIATIGVTPGFQAYEWRKDGTLIVGATSNTISITEFGSYTARIRRYDEWSPWSTIPVVISEKAVTETPDIQVEGLFSKVLPSLDGNTSVTLELPGGFVEYAWYRAGESQVLSTERVFTTSTPGDYEASVVEPFGCSSNRSQTFTVVDANGTDKPDPAIGFVGFASSETTIQLNWSENPTPNFNESGFEIYLSETEGGPYTLLHITEPDELSYTHNDLIANTTYYYVIRAVNETGASAATAELAVTTLVDDIAPTAPQNLSVVGTSPTSVELTWDASTDNVGVWKYDVYRNDVKSVVTDGTSVTVFNLVPENIYNFKIKARDITGNSSPFSNQVIAATVFTGTPLANLKFENDLSDASGNGTSSALRNGATFSTAQVKEGTHAFYSPNGNSYADFDTGNDFIHTRFTTRTVAFWLFAESTSGIQDVFDEGGSTNGFGIRINEGNIEVAVQDNQDIHLIGAPITAGEWRHVTATYNEGSLKLYVDGFELASEEGIGFDGDEVSDHGDGSGVGATNGSNAFDVANNNFIGYIDDLFIDYDVLSGSQILGLMNGSSEFEIPDVLPNAPTELTAAAISYDAIDLTWTDNSEDETGFQLYRSLQEDGEYAPIAIVDPNTTTYQDTNLNPETTYHYQAIAIGQYGESVPPSNIPPRALLSLDNNLSDASDYGITSAARNGATFSSAQSVAGSHAGYFPGSNDYFDLDLGNSIIHSAFTQRSISFWFYTDNTNGIQDLFDEGGSTNGVGIRINNGNLEFATQQGHNIQSVTTSEALPVGQWVHQVSIFDNGTLSVYINGSLAASRSGIGYTSVSSHGNGGGLGATNSSNAFDAANNNFNGYIDEFALYDVALSEGDIFKLYNLASDQPFATTLPLPPVPEVATNLTAVALERNAIDLSWDDNSTNEDGYRILRSSGTNTNFLKLVDLDANAESYQDEGLFSNVTYFYKVEAFNAGGGIESPEVSAQTLNTPPQMDDFGDLALRYDEQLVISLFAQDPDNETLTFGSQNLPSFTSMVDVGDGSGALFITPSVADVGVYSNLEVFVTDENGGLDVVNFSIEVNGNHTPTIDEISNVTLEEGETTSIAFSAADQDGIETITWNVEGLPEFATFSDDGNGSASISIVTDFSSAGIYNVDVSVTDNEGAIATSSFVITVTDIDPNVTVLVNFKHTKNGPSPWNNVSSLTTNNLVDQNGSSTGIGIDFQTTTWKSYNDGAITGNDSGIFPDNVIDDYYYFGIFGAPETVDVRVTGLDTERSYDFEFFASSVWSGAPDNGNTNYTINGNTVSLHVQGNNQNTALLQGISPNAFGEITFTMSKGIGASVGYINALVIKSIFDAGSVPATPTDLTSTFDSNQNVELSWIDAPFNEDGYRVHKSEDGTSFSIVAELDQNSTSYTDEAIADNQTYYYKVNAFNVIGNSEFSETITVNVPNTPPSLAPIGNITMGVDETLVVPISATDPPNNNITLTVDGLPSFASFTDFGAGAGEISITTTGTDVGTYESITITATDDAGDSRSEVIVLTVEESVLYTVSLNFTKNTNAPAPWNNTGKEPDQNDFFGNLLDDQSNNSGLGVRIVSDIGGSYNQGAQTGNDSGIVPDDVLKEYYWFGIFNAPQTVTLRVEGLSQAERYNFRFVGSSVFSGAGVSDNGETVYKIGNQEVLVDVHQNTANEGVISDIAADNNGYVYIELLKGPAAAAGYINSLVIEAVPADDDAFIPTNLTAVGSSQSAVQLSWDDRTPDESAFEIYRSDSDENGVFNIIGTVGADITTYVDNTVVPGMIHYYKVRSLRPSGATDFSNVANGSAILFSVLININGDPAYNQSAPWNNLASYPSDGQLYTGFRDLNGNETGIRVFVEKTMSGFNDWGTETGDDSGIYPDKVMKSFFFNDALVEPGLFNIEGLDQSLNYNFSFFGAIETGFSIFTEFTIGETTVTNSQTYNTTEASTIFGVKPDINGEARLQVKEASGSNWAIWNAMVIDAYPVPASGSSNARRTSVTSNASEVGTAITFGNENSLDLADLSVFPVPFADQVTLQIGGDTKGELLVRLIDLSGRALHTEKIDATRTNELEINTKNFDSGVYLIEVTDASGKKNFLKLLKQ